MLKLVRRHGSDRWYIRGTIRGVKVDETTGLVDKGSAEAARAKREWEIITGAQRTARGPIHTFRDALISYLEAGGEARFMAAIERHFGEKPLREIGQAEVENCARRLYPGKAPATINRQVFTPIAAVMRHAAVLGLVEPKVWKRPRQPKGRVRWLTPAEAERLIDACSQHLRPLVIFLFYTGARMGEALKLEWRDVDLVRAHAAFHDTKNGDSRGIPLHARVVAALANLEQKRGRVFRTPSGAPYPTDIDGGGQIKTAFKGACRRARITDFHPHDCRHTWATWYYAATRDMVGLMTLGGWSSPTMVQRYAHVNVSHLAGSVGQLPWTENGDSAGTIQIVSSGK